MARWRFAISIYAARMTDCLRMPRDFPAGTIHPRGEKILLNSEKHRLVCDSRSTPFFSITHSEEKSPADRAAGGLNFNTAKAD
jgi:hypothetical protein